MIRTISFLCCFLSALLSTHAGAQILPEQAWLAPEAPASRALTEAPRECLRLPAQTEQRLLIEVGRAAFRSPFLLGGPVARKGLSCESCHRGGHDNPDFFVQGLSGAPGTADVTSFFVSATRGDGIANPVPIPDLHGVAAKKQFGTVAPVDSLTAFVEAAIVEEFQGARPPRILVSGLVAYMEALDLSSCTSPEKAAPLSGELWLDDIRRTLTTAHRIFGQGEYDASAFLVLSSRGMLGRLHARYHVQGLERLAKHIQDLSRTLADVTLLVKAQDKRGLQGISQALRDMEALKPVLAAAHGRSLFNLDVLEIYLTRENN